MRITLENAEKLIGHPNQTISALATAYASAENRGSTATASSKPGLPQRRTSSPSFARRLHSSVG